MIENKDIFLKDFGEEFVVQGTNVSFYGIFSIEKVLWESGDGASVETYVPSIVVFDNDATMSIVQSDMITRVKTGAEYTLPQPVYWASTGQGIIKMEEV